ncbi:MAG: family 1 extracellular solute-binding protein, partial [Paenibacillus sp.]|nr:family 1 extracellular solute-binding protein [Paenibacillus sp.]
MKKLSIGLLTVVLLAGGCSSAQKPANKQDETKLSTEPVTLKLYNYGALTPEVIDQMFVKPIKQKYPHITLEVVKLSDMPIANIAVSGNEMDIITGWGSLLDQFGNYKLLTDLNPYVQKHKIDLSRFEKSNLEGIRLQSDTIAKGSLMALPFGYNYYATFYNKDIFDKF